MTQKAENSNNPLQPSLDIAGVSGSCFTEDEIKAILTDTKHILKCVDLEEKDMLVRMNIVWKIEHNYR